MRKLMVALVALVMASSALGATGWYSDYVLISLNGDPAQYYWIGDDPSFGTRFDSTHLGTVGAANSLRIGADMRYWSDTQDRDGGAFYWTLDGATTPNEVIWTQTYLGGNDYQGTEPAVHVVVQGGTPGQHTLSVWAKSWGTGQGDSWLSNEGNNYNATFTIVPEPTTLVLIGAGIAGLLAYRRRR